jgi:hypothetical protein
VFHDDIDFIVKVLPSAEYDREIAAVQTKGVSS